MADGVEAGLVDAFLRQRERLEAYVRRFVSSRETAADLVQDAFVRIWNGRDRLGDRDPVGYMFRTAHNLSIDHLRAQRVQRDYRAREAPRLATLGAADPEAETAARQDIAALEAALRRLPAQTRRVFLMSRVEGRGYGEIAAALGISRSAVEKHMLKALQHCRDCLAARR